MLCDIRIVVIINTYDMDLKTMSLRLDIDIN